MLQRIPGVPKLIYRPELYPLKLVFGRVFINVCMGVGFLTFGLVKTKHWLTVCLLLYFVIEIVFLWSKVIYILFSSNTFAFVANIVL